MLQSLAAERFRLKSHKETREFPAYEFVVAKSGPKLGRKLTVTEGFPDLPPGKPGMATTHATRNGQSLAHTRAQQMPVGEIVALLWRSADAPIVDRTGLASPRSPSPHRSSPPSSSSSVSSSSPSAFTLT